MQLGAITEPKIDQAGPPPAGEFAYVDISSIDNKTKRIVDAKRLPAYGAPSRARQRLRAGDVLVSMTRPNLNAVALVPPELDGAIGSTGFHVLRARGSVLPQCLYYGVQTRQFVGAMSELVQGALYPAVRPKDIRVFDIPLPALDEQRRVVAEFVKQVLRLRPSRRHPQARQGQPQALQGHRPRRCRYAGRAGSAGSAYDGLQIEIQLRTRLQHAWATAVETVGTMLEQLLKSSEGSADWLRFFALVGSAFAFVERTPAVTETPASPGQLASEIERLQAKLKVKDTLDTYRHALKATEQQGKGESALYLLSLDPAAKQLTVTAYGAGEIMAATDAYAEAERHLALRPGAQVVLVGSRSLTALRKAYPNYFLDTEIFLSQLDRALRRLDAATAWPRVAHPGSGQRPPGQGELW